MMMQQRLAWNVRSVRGLLFDALVLLFALVFAAAVAAAKPTHATRLRRAETMQATPDFSRPMRSSRSRRQSRSKAIAQAGKADRVEVRAETSSRVRGRGSRAERAAERRADERGAEVHAVKESRVEARRTRSRHERVELASDRESKPEKPVKTAKKSMDTAKKLSVDDFLRAAKGESASAKPAGTTEDANATGVSNPDADEPTVTRIDAEAAHAQQHDVTEALAKAQSSADSDGGVTAPPAVAVDAGSGTQVAVNPQPKLPAHASRSDMDVLLKPSHEEMALDAIAPRLPGLYSRDGRLIVPAPLRGTREILIHQNEMADAAGLNRIRTDAQLDSMRSHHLLVSFPESAGLRVNPSLPEDRRCARPWTVQFASDTARAFYTRFHEPLEVNSAVRTVAYQRKLQRVNGNAAAIDGDAASPHLTGQALDFGKRGMSLTEIAWMRAYLLPLMQGGKLDVEEEFQQACFHISVYRSYVRGDKVVAAKGEVAELK